MAGYNGSEERSDAVWGDSWATKNIQLLGDDFPSPDKRCFESYTRWNKLTSLFLKASSSFFTSPILMPPPSLPPSPILRASSSVLPHLLRSIKRNLKFYSFIVTHFLISDSCVIKLLNSSWNDIWDVSAHSQYGWINTQPLYFFVMVMPCRLSCETFSIMLHLLTSYILETASDWNINSIVLDLVLQVKIHYLLSLQLIFFLGQVRVMTFFK